MTPQELLQWIDSLPSLGKMAVFGVIALIVLGWLLFEYAFWSRR